MHNSRVAPLAVQTDTHGINTSISMATNGGGPEELQLDSASEDGGNDGGDFFHTLKLLNECHVLLVAGIIMIYLLSMLRVN